MDVPKNIQESIIKSAKYNEISLSHNKKVRDWLEIKKMDDKLGIIDALIDTLEMGNNNPQYLIDFIEKEKWNYTELQEDK